MMTHALRVCKLSNKQSSKYYLHFTISKKLRITWHVTLCQKNIHIITGLKK